MFDKKSRYADQPTYIVKDRRGRDVAVVEPAPDPNETLRGYHVRTQGQRLDHLSAGYLKNAAGFWRICELNSVMMAEMLSEVDEIGIPDRKG